ncbi:MAG: N-acyl amino acid synthase FeeM domain-containing protein [Roseiarcus sp.]
MTNVAIAKAPTNDSAFADDINDFLERVEYRAALRDFERQSIYRMRYSAYAKEGALPPGAPEIFKDRYDDAANGVTYGVYVDGALASSMRFHILGPNHPDAPAMQVFASELQPLVDVGRIILDPTRFVVDVARVRLFPKIPYATVRLALMACEYFETDFCLATVRDEHRSFYKRLFGKPTEFPTRPYPMLAKPIGLMTFDLSLVLPRAHIRYPFLCSTPEEREQVFGGCGVRSADRRSPFGRVFETR